MVSTNVRQRCNDPRKEGGKTVRRIRRREEKNGDTYIYGMQRGKGTGKMEKGRIHRHACREIEGLERREIWRTDEREEWESGRRIRDGEKDRRKEGRQRVRSWIKNRKTDGRNGKEERCKKGDKDWNGGGGGRRRQGRKTNGKRVQDDRRGRKIN